MTFHHLSGLLKITFSGCSVLHSMMSNNKTLPLGEWRKKVLVAQRVIQIKKNK